MKGYKSSEVYGKLKAARKRFARMEAANIPHSVRARVSIASRNIEMAIEEYERLKAEK